MDVLYNVHDMKERVFSAENAEFSRIAEKDGAVVMDRLVDMYDIVYKDDGTLEYKNVLKTKFNQNLPHQFDSYLKDPENIVIKLSLTINRNMLFEQETEKCLLYQGKLISRILKKNILIERGEFNIQEEKKLKEVEEPKKKLGFLQRIQQEWGLEVRKETPNYKRVLIYKKIFIFPTSDEKEIKIKELAERYVNFTRFKESKFKKIEVYSGTNAFTLPDLFSYNKINLKNVLTNTDLRTKEPPNAERVFVVHTYIIKKDIKFIK